MSTYLVTGGAGFIGSNIVTQLARAGHDIRILDNLTGIGAAMRAADLSDTRRVQLIKGDIRESVTCREACAGVDYVLHHAAEPSVIKSVEDPSYCAAVNIGGTINMLTAAKDAGTVKRFVFASSCAVYGDTPSLSKLESSPVEPITPYATSKLAGEYFCHNFYRLHGLQTVALRYFNVYGPGQDPNGAYAAVIPKFLTRIVNGEAPIIDGDGEQSRDFIHIQDIVEANLQAAIASPDIAGRVFNIGSGHATSLNQLIKMLERIMGREIGVIRREPRAGDIKHSLADISAAVKLLGFSPKVPIDQGLAQTLQSYQ